MKKLMNKLHIDQCHLGDSDLMGIKGGVTATITIQPSYDYPNSGSATVRAKIPPPPAPEPEPGGGGGDIEPWLIWPN
jgi:hypothetical protein